MNKWECGEPGCDASVLGVGAAIGLLAIGWFFQPGTTSFGPVLRCPRHRPDGIPCSTWSAPDEARTASCSPCAGERVAAHLQLLIARELDAPGCFVACAGCGHLIETADATTRCADWYVCSLPCATAVSKRMGIAAPAA